jgi:hypothetical protein
MLVIGVALMQLLEGLASSSRLEVPVSAPSSNGVLSPAMMKGQLVTASGVLGLSCCPVLGGLGPVVVGRCPVVLVLLYGFCPFSQINLPHLNVRMVGELN